VNNPGYSKLGDIPDKGDLLSLPYSYFLWNNSIIQLSLPSTDSSKQLLHPVSLAGRHHNLFAGLLITLHSPE
jgi:hypothetical protein